MSWTKAVGVAVFGVVLAWGVWLGLRSTGVLETEPGNRIGRAGGQTTEGSSRPPGWLAAREQRIAETVWAKELLAQACGRTFEELWETILAATNKIEVAAAFPVGEVVLARWTDVELLAHGIRVQRPVGQGPVVPASGWRSWVSGHAADGWELVQVEFRHNRFDTDNEGKPRQSRFYGAAHLVNAGRAERVLLEGDLIVDWLAGPTDHLPATVKRVDARGLTIRSRRGEPPFRCVLHEEVAPSRDRFSVDPLILHDLDGDGLSEILLPSVNALYRRESGSKYGRASLCRFPPGVVFTAVVADFNEDGSSDLLCARAEGLVLYAGPGGPSGFGEPERLVWLAPEPLKNPMALTAGDVDRDGDLDLFLGQYRVPTMGQVLKPRYYDANDGLPAYLLLNDGNGQFTDGTVRAGLEPKRARRTYTASLADLDSDGWQDLVVVSDFAGLDVYRNEGLGRFRDITEAWVPDPKGFGMAHAFADFNLDGRLDLLMIGMNSPTADRLDHLGLRRPGSEEDFSMRPRMAFGNRLLLARATDGFEQTGLNDALARTGWSWGCSAADFDNDGFADVYIANGLQSQASVRDFEPEFWLHDRYIEETVADQEATRYFMDKAARTRGRGWSYGGHERNRLYLNLAGRTFVETAFLMGVALPEDSRCVVTDDLDGDGRLDLLVTTFEVWPRVRQTLHVYKNMLADTGHWIGLRFRERPGGGAAVGALVTVVADGRQSVRQLVTGDSHRAQHAAALHFGLGTAPRVTEVRIRWPDGQEELIADPGTNRNHTVSPPPPARPTRGSP